MFKRILSLVMTVCLSVCMGAAFPVCVSAEEGAAFGDGLYWSFADNTLTISGAGEMELTYSGGPWKSVTDTISSVVIGDDVLDVGMYAFNYSSIENVYIGNSVKVIDPSAFSGSIITDIEIPDSVVYISNCAFMNNSKMESLKLGSNLQGIGIQGFDGCTALKEIVIPDSTKYIGEKGFYGCNAASKIVLGKNTEYIDKSAFDYCNSVQEVVMPDVPAYFGDGAFRYVNAKKVYISNLEAWLGSTFASPTSTPGSGGYDLYMGGELVEDLVIPEGTESIPDYAFQNCNSIKTVTIPDSVASIGISAFANCTNLKTVNFGNGGQLKSIGESAFKGIAAEEIDVPYGVESIGDFAFYNCKSLSSITLPDTLMSVGMDMIDGSVYYSNKENWENNILYAGNYLLAAETWAITGAINIKDGTIAIADYCFGYSTATELNMPDSLKTIGKYAFNSCSSLSKIKFSSSLEEIGESAFSGCTQLTEVVIPDKVRVIKNDAFRECTALVSVDIGDSVETIGDYAFYGCTELSELTIGSGLKHIKYSAFGKCAKLTEIILPNGCETIEDGAFTGCTGVTDIVLPDSISSLAYELFADTAYYKDTTNWTDAGELYIDNILISVNSNATGEYTIREGTTYIGVYAFKSCSFTKINIPSSVNNIGEHAFEYCHKLTSIVIPDSVKTLGTDAFHGCSKLESVALSKELTTIEYGTFYNCKNLNNVVIPDKVEAIGARAFYGCAVLSDITFGKALKSIAEYAFNNIDVLENVDLSNTMIESIGERAFYDCDKLTSLTAPKTLTYVASMAYFGTPIEDYENYVNGAFITGGCLVNTDESKIVGTYTIPDGVRQIRAFRTTDLETLYIPRSVTKIEDNVFADNYKLKDVYYTGTLEDWEKIDIGYNNYLLSSVNLHIIKETGIIFEDNSVRAETDKGILCVGGYTAGGRLVKINVVDGYSTTLDEFEGCAYVKAFIFEDMISLKPLFESKKKEI